MRDPAEIRFRLRQEIANARMLVWPPRTPADGGFVPLRGLPEVATIADRLRGSDYAAEVEAMAEDILRHEFAILGIRLATGPEIRWRRDYTAGIETGTPYFRALPYLDVRRCGDHKQIWELSRHQHLVLLAQAWRLTGRREFFDETIRQLESWLEQNPFQRGVNWASALEVAFRALSWIWIYHLAGEAMPDALRRRFLTALFRHGAHLERNLSVYFSRNTHLMGEALALHALGALFPDYPGARRWADAGAAIMAEELRFQVRPDGAHFEQSTYYHVYALDMFLLHAILARPGREYLDRLARMADYLDALLGPARAIPLIGDDDGGRLFHPYGERAEFGRATLATASLLLGRDWPWAPADVPEQAAWWLGADALAAKPSPRSAAPQSRLFPDSGLAILASGDTRVYVDAGPMGFGNAGHGHSDALSIIVRQGAAEVLVDSGTYTYVSDPQWRNAFRGSAAHNTLRINGLDQAAPAGPFGWKNQPDVRILDWAAGEAEDRLRAECRCSRGFVHRRTALFRKPDRIEIVDEVEGPPGQHLVEQFWRPGGAVVPEGEGRFRIGAGAVLSIPDGAAAEVSSGWRSTVFGAKKASPVIRVAVTAALPLRLSAVLTLDENGAPGA